MVQENIIKNKILIICGPTASGKSDLAIQCAKLLNSEIISADSMYIYRGLNIGTAKPTIEEMQGVKHHLIDVVDANNTFTVSDYKKIAEPILENLIAQGKTPIICGGTGFYINSLLYDLSYGNGNENTKIREKYKKLAQEQGNIAVFNVLKEVDPESASKLHFNDVKRVVRALEIYENGTKKSDIQDSFAPKYDYLAFSINHTRETLYKRINCRVDLMIKNGLIDEIDNLVKNGINKENQCMQAIGYKEFFEYLDGNCTLQNAIDNVKLNTRHYAKRQITFFKKLPNLQLLEPNDTYTLAQKIVNAFNERI